MNDLLQNEITTKQIAGYLRSPTSSLLVEGSHYEGVIATAQQLISQLLGVKNKARLLTVGEDPSINSITVQDIRDSKLSMKTKMAASEGFISRIVFIAQAEKMTHEAQNALLKTLEEPTAHTVLILGTTNRSKLLETIRSRCQIIRVLPISESQAIAYGEKQGYETSDVTTAYHIASGDPVLFQAILNQDETNSFKQHIDKAKSYLQLDVFSRIIAIDEFSKTSSDLRILLQGLERISEAALHRSNTKDRKRWINIAEEVRECRDLLDTNVLVKLLYLRLSQSI